MIRPIATALSALGIFYRLDNSFSVVFFIHRTLHSGKIYPVKKNKNVFLNLIFNHVLFSRI